MNLSANGNNGTSQYILTMLYFEGKYCKKDINKSIQYLISSANNDYPLAQFDLGVLYYDRYYIQKNDEY